VLEADEMWSFVYKRWNKRWVLDRHVSSDSSNRGFCHRMIAARQPAVNFGNKFPQAYRTCQSYSDFWEAYQLVFPEETHECVGKGSGQTNHMERWYNTLRQSSARFIRKTLSFSKSDAMHEIITRLFIIRHNLSLIT